MSGFQAHSLPTGEAEGSLLPKHESLSKLFASLQDAVGRHAEVQECKTLIELDSFQLLHWGPEASAPCRHTE